MILLIKLILGISFISLILILWFCTDVWLEYTRLLKLNFLSAYKRYDEEYKKDVSLTYLHFLRQHYDCFLIRMITCPICLSVWLGIISGICIPVLYIPICILSSLFIFLAFEKLLK